MGKFHQRLGEKGKKAWRVGKKVAVGAMIVGGAVLGMKEIHERGKAKATEKIGEKKEELVEKGKEKFKQVKEEHGEAVAVNVKYLAGEGASGIVAGGKAGLKAQVLPKALGGGDVKAQALKAGEKHETAVRAHTALIQEVGNVQSAEAVKQRYQLHTAPEVVRGGGAGSLGKFACQTGCVSAHPKRKGKKYRKCMERCD